MPIPFLLKPNRIVDERGWLVETYSERTAEGHGIGDRFVQDNHSLSRTVGTLRGLHFQIPPRAQAKLVRCLAGRILDVAVDIRRGSPSFGRAVAVELSARNSHQLYVPVGFAHGFLTLEPDSEVAYKLSDHYAPELERGIRFDSAGAEWPLPADEMVLSPKDRALPPLADLASPFGYDGDPLPERLA